MTDDYGNEATIPTPNEPTLNDVMGMLQALQSQISAARKERADEIREWSHWRSQMDSSMYNLSERVGELTKMYEHVVEALPLIRRIEFQMEEIHAWMLQGGVTARRHG